SCQVAAARSENLRLDPWRALEIARRRRLEPAWHLPNPRTLQSPGFRGAGNWLGPALAIVRMFSPDPERAPDSDRSGQCARFRAENSRRRAAGRHETPIVRGCGKRRVAQCAREFLQSTARRLAARTSRG